MKQALLILPHQLYQELPSYFKDMPVFLVEHEHFFTRMKFHKQKLLLHRATMQMYKDHLKKKHHAVHYYDFKESKNLFADLKKHEVQTLHFFDPTDIPLENKLIVHAFEHGISLMSYESPNFLSPLDIIEDTLDGHTHFRMQHFYEMQRKELNILMDGEKPAGGKWSFDAKNHQPISHATKIPAVKKAAINDYVREAATYVEKHFKNNHGSTEQFIYPTTFASAKKWLDNFLEERFKHFGTHQDAMLHGEHFLFHSGISAALNIGLLNPDYIVKEALNYASKHRITLNNIEGFISQIIGWREFVRAVYIMTEGTQQTQNCLRHTRKLSPKFWRGETGIEPIDDVVKKVQDTGYAHHNERLMVIGNFMLLSETDPNEAYQWFMQMFIDSYDWAVIPNVYGISQYADGGRMISKPCIASSNYIRTMSNYKKGDWCALWDALYWHFLKSKKRTLGRNARLKLSFMYLDKLKKTKRAEYMARARKYLKK